MEVIARKNHSIKSNISTVRNHISYSMVSVDLGSITDFNFHPPQYGTEKRRGLLESRIGTPEFGPCYFYLSTSFFNSQSAKTTEVN